MDEDNENYPVRHNDKPFWNDGDKISGLAATVTIGLFLLLLIAGVAKLLIWMITGEWTL